MNKEQKESWNESRNKSTAWALRSGLCGKCFKDEAVTVLADILKKPTKPKQDQTGSFSKTNLMHLKLNGVKQVVLRLL